MKIEAVVTKNIIDRGMLLMRSTEGNFSFECAVRPNKDIDADCAEKLWEKMFVATQRGFRREFCELKCETRLMNESNFKWSDFCCECKKWFVLSRSQ